MIGEKGFLSLCPGEPGQTLMRNRRHATKAKILFSQQLVLRASTTPKKYNYEKKNITLVKKTRKQTQIQILEPMAFPKGGFFIVFWFPTFPCTQPRLDTIVCFLSTPTTTNNQQQKKTKKNNNSPKATTFQQKPHQKRKKERKKETKRKETKRNDRDRAGDNDNQTSHHGASLLYQSTPTHSPPHSNYLPLHSHLSPCPPAAPQISRHTVRCFCSLVHPPLTHLPFPPSPQTLFTSVCAR